MQILPTITTITDLAWLDKIKEIKKLKLKEVCLFPTCLNKEQREKLYALLKDTDIERIPFVHLRSDMELSELDYLVKRYQTRIFNIHSKKEFVLLDDYGSYKKSICIENTPEFFDEQEINEFGGTCLDISHLENARLLRPDIYQANIRMLRKYPPKCSHISVIKKESVHSHYFEDLSEFDYLKRYPLEYFGQIAAIELENSIQEQLDVIRYIKTAMKY
ncbi:MAG: hypothetical protein ABH831_01610 [Candidatus Nealsonbacteria bacterium]